MYASEKLHFPLDRSADKLKVVEDYLKANKMFRNYNDASQDPVFSEVSPTCKFGPTGICCDSIISIV